MAEKLTQPEAEKLKLDQLREVAGTHGVTVDEEVLAKTKEELLDLLKERGVVESDEEREARETSEEEQKNADEEDPQETPAGTRYFVAQGIVPSLVLEDAPPKHDGTPSGDGTLVKTVDFDPFVEVFNGDQVRSGFLATDDEEVFAKLETEDGLIPGVAELDADEYEKRTSKATRVAR